MQIFVSDPGYLVYDTINAQKVFVFEEQSNQRSNIPVDRQGSSW